MKIVLTVILIVFIAEFLTIVWVWWKIRDSEWIV